MKSLIWIASYPKSGNTWFRFLLGRYLTGAAVPLDLNRIPAPNAADVTAADRLGVIDIADLTLDEQQDLRPSLHRALAGEGRTPACLKVHDGFGLTPSGECLFPPEVSLAAVYLVRHPGDVTVSLAHHFGVSLGEAITYLGQDARLAIGSRRQFAQHLGTWSHHVQGWLGQVTIPVVVVRYEDLSVDAAGELSRVLGAVGLVADSHLTNRVVEDAQFCRLQAAERERGFVERSADASAPFFREGQVGGWRHQISPEGQDQLWRDHGSVMRQLGYGA